MSIAVRLAVVAVTVTGLLSACDAGTAAPSAGPRPAPTTSTPRPPSTPATTTTTTPPLDGFTPIVPGADLTRMVTPLGTILRIDPKFLSVSVMPGTTEPGGSFPEGGEVPLAARANLVAATNAGFKRADARGGELVDGRSVGTLQPGAASFVIRADGTFDVGAWQQEVLPEPGDVAVLQNLAPLIDHGQPAPALGTNILGRWGATFRPALPVSVWRSGLGIDALGRLLYAAGPNLVPAQLAQLLLSGGAVRAMQLDINHLWVFAARFDHPSLTDPEVVVGQALLPGMTPTPGHVLVPGTRDFLAIFQRRTF
ncbi:MAG TPA: hypothetical protein VHT30_13475 [Acidimicrobiales bacterium]|nr:hypothetical protein [Acidimicrobiales bacterium]